MILSHSLRLYILHPRLPRFKVLEVLSLAVSSCFSFSAFISSSASSGSYSTYLRGWLWGCSEWGHTERLEQRRAHTGWGNYCPVNMRWKGWLEKWNVVSGQRSLEELTRLEKNAVSPLPVGSTHTAWATQVLRNLVHCFWVRQGPCGSMPSSVSLRVGHDQRIQICSLYRRRRYLRRTGQAVGNSILAPWALPGAAVEKHSGDGQVSTARNQLYPASICPFHPDIWGIVSVHPEIVLQVMTP